MYRMTAVVAKSLRSESEAAAAAGRLKRIAEAGGRSLLGIYSAPRVTLLLTCPDGKVPDPRFHDFRVRNDGASVAEGYLYESGAENHAARIGDAVRATPFGDAPPVCGHFLAADYDSARDSFDLCADRYGMRPVFAAETRDAWLFGQDFALLADAFGVAGELDRSAAAQLLSMELIADDRTLFTGVRRLPNAARVRVDRGEMRSARYWDFPFGRARPVASDREEILRAISSALDRAMDVEAELSGADLIVPLSGGMDSRVILAHMAERRGTGVPAFTLDLRARGSVERAYARRVASAVGADWRFLELAPATRFGVEWPRFSEWLGPWASLYQSWSAHGYRSFDRGRPMRAVYGLAFDVQLATNPSFVLRASLPFRDVVDRLVRKYAGDVGRFAAATFTPAFGGELLDAPRRAVAAALAPLEGSRAEDLAEYLFWTGRARSYTAAEFNGNLRFVSFGFPYLHPDVFDLLAAVPHDVKNEYELYAAYVARRLPRIAAIPNGNTGARVGRPVGVLRRARELLERIESDVLRASRGRLEPRLASGADFAWLFRRDPGFRSDLLAVFESRRVADAGLIDERGLRDLCREVDEGRSYLFPWLIRLAGVELALRRFGR